MPANMRSTQHPFDTDTYGDAAFSPDDDAPDLSAPEWVAKFAETRLQRGRPKAGITKVSTTLRLDPDVLERFKSSGPGWQGRMNAALRRAAGLTP
jgi:uncharacterized protein (DUF4415 family)